MRPAARHTLPGGLILGQVPGCVQGERGRKPCGGETSGPIGRCVRMRNDCMVLAFKTLICFSTVFPFSGRHHWHAPARRDCKHLACSQAAGGGGQ